MLRRRTFLSLVAGSFAVPQVAAAQQLSRKVALYANVGPISLTTTWTWRARR